MVKLSNEQLESLASRKGVKRVAVENFLMSAYGSYIDNLQNVRLDARLYKWNAATVNAINDGLKIIFKS